MKSSPKALVLAAGKSTRIFSVSKGRPKPLIEVEGEAILSRNLRWLAAEGIEEVFVNLHYKADDIREYIQSRDQLGVRVSYSFEPEILGTAGAAKALQSQLSDTFVVVYGDNLITTSIADLMASHVNSGAEATIALYDRHLHLHTGIAGGRVKVDSSHKIMEFREGADDDFSSLVNAGIYVLQPRVFDYIPENVFCDFAKDVFPKMIDAKVKINSAKITGYCLGLDTAESYERAIDLISHGKVRLQ